MGPWSERDTAMIEEALAERLGDALTPGEAVRVSGSTASTLVESKFVLSGGAEGERLELEARVDLARARLDPEAARGLALDALDLILLEYLESGRSQRFSGVFEERELDGEPVSVRVERTFATLEARADALLRGPGVDPGPND